MTSDTQREYLLGGFTPEERDQIAAQYFSSSDAFDQMLVAELDLLDAYVRGQLAAADRQRVEKYLLTSETQMQKLAVAQGLFQAANPRKFSYLRYLPYAAIVVVGAGLSVQYLKQNATVTPGAVASRKTAGPFVVELVANSVRGGDARLAIAIPQDAELIRIRFEAAEQDGVLTAELLASGGASVWEQPGLSAKAGIASFDLPSSVLRSGSFEMYVRDARGNTTGYFPFSVR